MLVVQPPSRTKVKHHRCDYHKRNPGKAWPGCTCSSSWSVEAKPREEWTFEETLEYVRALGLGQALDLGFDDLSEEELDDYKREIQEVLGEPMASERERGE